MRGSGSFPEIGFASLILAEGTIDVPATQVIYVPEDFKTIREAIKAANPGDTISVGRGTYYEELTIDIPLTLEGNGHTRLIGGGDPVAIRHANIFISADDVMVSGFTLLEEGDNVVELVGLFSANRILIKNNKMIEGWTGIRSFVSSELQVVGNVIKDSYGSGMSIWGASQSVVSGNSVLDGRFGIALYGMKGSTVIDNKIQNNKYTGLVLSSCSDDLIVGNTILSNGYGIVDGSSSGNTLYHNNFIENAVQIKAFPSNNIWDNGYGEGNFWSGYEGEDLNKDGVGDTLLPHHGVDYFPLSKVLR